MMPRSASNTSPRTRPGLCAAGAIVSIMGSILLASLVGCGGQDSIENVSPTEAPPKTNTEVVETVILPEPSLIPKDAQFLSEADERETYEDGTVRLLCHKQRYSGGTTIYHGEFKEFSSNGRPLIAGTYDKGKRVGDWSFWFQNGQLAHTEHYVAGKLDGSWTVFNEDGTKSQDVCYRNNKKNGTWVQYDTKGSKRILQTELRDGIKNGLQIEWYPSGQKKIEANFVDDKFDGLRTEYFENGKKKLETEYRRGQKNGKESQYKESGEPIFVREFRDGRPVVTKKPG